ncbi:MAG TPA: FkbM family methyltransferase [Terriglobales bacterium]|nr:FkbM family methyltransferase [Terriglobales bacterium]
MTVSQLQRKLHSVREIQKTYDNWPQWFISRMGIDFLGSSAEIKTGRSRLVAPRNFESWGIADQVWREKVYTRHFPILQGYRVLDIGAHYGFFTVFAALENEGVKVVAYEPSKSTFQILRNNLEGNRLDRQSVLAFNCGLADKSGDAVFYKPEGHDASGTLFAKNVSGASCRVLEEVVRIEEAVRIWDVFDWYDFAKLDCEGAELPILRHLGDQVRRLGHIVLEYHQDPNNLVEFLSSKHFSIVEIVPLESKANWNAFSHLGMLYARNTESWMTMQ